MNGVYDMRRSFLYLAALTMMTGALMLAAPEAAMASPEENQSQETNVETNVEVEDEDIETEEVLDEAAVKRALASAQAVTDSMEVVSEEQEARKEVVSYALQFVGGRYRAGGNDPHTGADCSGFVKYVMQNGAGVSMNRSSASQASQGKAISSDQMQPGDLIFYSNGSRINHVAMYIGDGQIVHASTYKTGIKVSEWNYRTPVKIVSMLG